MLSTKITSYLKIWEIEDDPNANNVKVVRVSSSRKVKEDSNYDKSLEEHGIAKNGYVHFLCNDLSFTKKYLFKKIIEIYCYFFLIIFS